MNIADEIRQQIEKCKGLKLEVGEINNHLSILEGLVRKDIEERKNEAYQRGLEEGYERGLAEGKKAFDLLDAERDAEYQRGLEDAWEAAKKIADMWTRIDNDELLAIFGITERIENSTIRAMFEKQTANEAMLELEAYEEKQKADDEIKVGDEVRGINGNEKLVITAIESEYDHCVVMTKRGGFFTANLSSLVKTDKHYDIASILKEMQS